MRIAQINMIHFGSTGKIMLQIAETARDMGHETMTFSTQPFRVSGKRTQPPLKDHFYWGSFFENGIHYALGSTLARNGYFSFFGTRQLIKQLEKFKPDVINLHNLHSYCINFPMLFKYIRKNNIRTVWTLHDCWSFTGQCPYFDMIGCDKWKTGCHHCPQISAYPKARFDNSKQMWKVKKKWFTGVENMTLVTPSSWLADLVSQSFLKDYPIRVINNGIDLSVFKPTESDFREKYGIGDKKIILGVAFGFGERKGLDVFVELAKRLDSSKYQIVLVGTDKNTDAILPDNILSIHRTQNQTELAEIYTAADVLANPTREDNYPTVNMEAIACGTPVVTFDTGGSPEIPNSTCGSVVARDDIDAFEKELIRVCEEKPYSEEACLMRAAEFDMYKKFKEYVELYEDRSYSSQRTV